MKAIQTLFSFLSGIVYICIICFLLIAAPLAAGFRPVVVLSGSMEPSYHVGSVIYYKKASFEAIVPGDAITFYTGEGNTMVTHRVIERDDSARTFTTQGDANNGPDPQPVPYDRVAGKAAGVAIPYAGYFVTYGRQIPVIAVMAFILLADMIFGKKSADKEKGKKMSRSS